MGKSLVKTSPQKPPPPQVEDSQSVSASALQDANVEDLRFLQDLALELPYSDFAVRGMTIQNFLRTRQLAFQDVFEDISEGVKQESLTKDGKLDPAAVRAQPEYAEMVERFRALTEKFSKPESDRAWLQRIAGRNRRNMERFARTNDKDLLRDAGRAAAEILEREMPKASRAQLNLGPQFHFTLEGAELLARAFAENKLAPPPITIESRAIEDEKPKDPK